MEFKKKKNDVIIVEFKNYYQEIYILLKLTEKKTTHKHITISLMKV